MIERLRIRNFRRYTDATIHFQAGVNFIEGQNNVGKTTLFYAIEYALFGRVENFKTFRSLMKPGKRSLGVEIVFTSQKGERFLLQRIHQMPAKSKKTLEGHFTLKAILEDGERYELASDFGDTEDKLALRINELTGLTRRLFSIALHMRQGDIPTILDGAKELDIVLGVTAASIAEDELRQMALELEKESAGLPVFQERLRSVGNELAKVNEESSALKNEQKMTADKLKLLGEAADPRSEFDRLTTPLLEQITAYEERVRKTELVRQRLDDENQRLSETLKAGSKDEVSQEAAKLETEAAERAKATAKLRSELDEVHAQERKLDQQRGDLAGRIDRRKSLPKGKGAKCEVCGAPIKPAETAKELAEWTDELEQLDKTISELATRHKKLQTSVESENIAERKRQERLAQLNVQRQRLEQLEEGVAQRRKQFAEATSGDTAAFEAIQREAKSLAVRLHEAKYEASWTVDGEPSAVLASIRHAIHSLRQALAERVGIQIAERKALTDLLERFQAQASSLERRQAELEREQATAQAEAAVQMVKAARAERFRGISAGFKEYQVQLRSEAATKLAADTLELYRHLAQTDEFEALTIDPAHYSVQVTPRELGEEVPAGLYEGGGQRLLLGLAFRMAVAKLVEQCPFLLLDEPTYGLDTPHRSALLQRIGDQSVTRQILLVTHQAEGVGDGHRIRLTRREKDTVVVS